jgi:hypothetical protein
MPLENHFLSWVFTEYGFKKVGFSKSSVTDKLSTMYLVLLGLLMQITHVLEAFLFRKLYNLLTQNMN